MAVLKHFFEQGFLRPLKSQKKSEYGFVWVISSSFGANFMVNFHNSEISGILCHQVDIFAIFCSILTIDFSGPWNYRMDLNTVSCGRFLLLDVQKKWLTSHFHNRSIFGILCHNPSKWSFLALF